MLVRDPTNEMLEAYLKAKRGHFVLPAQTEISQVTVNRLKHGDATEKRANELLGRLREDAVSPADAGAVGDGTWLPNSLPLQTDKALARRFGHRFTETLKKVPKGQWSGPIASIYGFHVVYVHARKPPWLPPLEEIRKKVRRSFLKKLADDWLALRLQQLRKEFDVVVSGSAS